MITVAEAVVIFPITAAPDTKSPIQAAGKPPIKTVGAPGETIGSPVTVISVNLAAGNIITPLYRGK
jgi:hypothetical protein